MVGFPRLPLINVKTMVFFENGFSKTTSDMTKIGSLFYTIVFLFSRRVEIYRYRMTLKGQLQNLTSDQGRVMIQVDPNRSYCTSFDAPWCGKHMSLILMSVSLLNQKL